MKKEYFYTIYSIELKEGAEEINNDTLEDLKAVTQFDTMQEVAEYLDEHIKYIYSIKTIKNKYKLINQKYAIYKDYVLINEDGEEIEGAEA